MPWNASLDYSQLDAKARCQQQNPPRTRRQGESWRMRGSDGTICPVHTQVRDVGPSHLLGVFNLPLAAEKEKGPALAPGLGSKSGPSQP